jgi:hypothetical protein
MAKKGYDPYNKPTATKPKPKPNPYKAGPNNPYNNAGPKVKASSRGPTSYNASFDRPAKGNNARKALVREADRAFMQNSDKSYTSRAMEANTGMTRKNAARKTAVDSARKARPSKIGWAKAGGGAAKGSAVKWGTAGAKKAAPQMLGAYAKGIAATAGRALGPIGAVATAGQAGYMIGTALNKKFNISGRIVDAVSPSYNPNDKGRSRTLTKSGSYDSPALKQHLKKKAKKR